MFSECVSAGEVGAPLAADEYNLNQLDIYRLIKPDLVKVEEELARHSGSNIQLIDRISHYVQGSGGKRIRPAMLLLSARMCGYEGTSAFRLGAVVELIHAATLVHDDIIDEAKVRRGHPSVNAEWGNQITVLMGDWLYMTSFNAALAERKFEILDILTDVTRKMIEGELIQLAFNGSLDITEEQHLDISRRKTAFLFSACAQIGGILGGADKQQQERLRLYGLNVGVAFQMVDDVLDFSSTESALGKPVVNDLKEGKLTLPLIYLVQAEPQYREMVRTALREDGSATVPREAVVRLVREHGTLDRVLEKAHAFAQEAKGHLDGFPECSARDALQSIPDYIVERDR